MDAFGEQVLQDFLIASRHNNVSTIQMKEAYL